MGSVSRLLIDGQLAAPSSLCFRDDLPGVLLKPRFLPRGEPEMVVGEITPGALRARQLLDNLTASALTTGCSLSISGYSFGYGGWIHSLVDLVTSVLAQALVPQPMLLHAALKGNVMWSRANMGRFPKRLENISTANRTNVHHCLGRNLSCFLDSFPSFKTGKLRQDAECFVDAQLRSNASVAAKSLFTASKGVKQLQSRFWAVCTLLERILQPSEWLADRLDQKRIELGLNESHAQRPRLSMHMRRGDSCSDGKRTGRICSNGTAYATAVMEMVSNFGYRSLVVTSDSDDAVGELRAALASRGWQPHWPIIASTASQSAERDRWFKESPRDKIRIEAQWAAGDLDPWEDFESFLIDIFLLRESDGFVGKFTSNFDRLVFELMSARFGCVRPYLSLDASWCFGGYQTSPDGNRHFRCGAPADGHGGLNTTR
jgi:hypothetical protein